MYTAKQNSTLNWSLEGRDWELTNNSSFSLPEACSSNILKLLVGKTKLILSQGTFWKTSEGRVSKDKLSPLQ